MPVKDQFKDMSEQIRAIEPLWKKLLRAKDSHQKLEIVNSIPEVDQFLSSTPSLQRNLNEFDANGRFLIKALLAMGQGHVVFLGFEDSKTCRTNLEKFVDTMREIEKFYEPIGGIVGYHLTILKLIHANHCDAPKGEYESDISYLEPEGLDLSEESAESRQAVRWGIEHMEEMAEIYPVGGAGDRLQLEDEATQKPLPAAQLPFCGRTLFEGMIRDLQGREFLYYKLFNKQLITPIAVMTSHEKNNHQLILEICEANHWFGRSRDHFSFFWQILVPMVTKEGFWAMSAPMQPILKPGGHGVLWKVAYDHGVFSWFRGSGRQKALVRQINNPAAGVDCGLLALTGIGCHKKKEFGFASCQRLLNMPEGMDVLFEKAVGKKYQYSISNIEYTGFRQNGIKDSPKEHNCPFSRFPANTNILFVDLETVASLAKRFPIPGMLINMKTKVTCLNPDGKKREKHVGRLESTMQNISDYIIDEFPSRLPAGKRDNLRTFITYNKRCKTISVAKQAYESGKPISGTPEGAHFEMMLNYHDLLENHCGMTLPPTKNEEGYLSAGPSIFAQFHPSLGGLYDIIAQKIRGGRVHPGSEWMMEIAEAEVVNLDLSGSLLISADAVMGKSVIGHPIVYDSSVCGKCALIDVIVKNKGIRQSPDNVFWKHQVTRDEVLQITLHGNGEFYAKNVSFIGDYHFDVADGHRMVVEEKDGQVISRIDKIDGPSWTWDYAFDHEDRIIISKK